MQRVVRWIPKVLAMTLLWGAVLYIIIYVEPATVANILIPGLYLPFVITIVLATIYTVLIATKSFRVATGVGAIVAVALVTMLLGYMNALIAISLLGMGVGLGLTLVKRS